MSSPYPSRRRAFLPLCAPLESRELLSTAHIPALRSLLAAQLAMSRQVAFGFPYYQYGFPFPNVQGPILTKLTPAPTFRASTIPASGDLNPYGLAIVPTNGFFFNGLLRPGDFLVSNFNNNTNTQGTGTSIVKVSPNGQTSLF